jgi:hypothetical protein
MRTPPELDGTGRIADGSGWRGTAADGAPTDCYPGSATHDPRWRLPTSAKNFTANVRQMLERVADLAAGQWPKASERSI